jgi:ribosomal protein L16 Arg81 hydroxylase
VLALSGREAFAQLISPIGVEEFFARNWEREPLLCPRTEPQYFDNLLTLDDVDQVLSTIKLRGQDIRVARDARMLSPSTYLVKPSDPHSDVDAEKVYQLFDQSHTIIINGIDRWWAPMGRFAGALEGLIHGKVQVNVYITPQSAVGFGPHFDTHDVFLLQITGSKAWRYWDSGVKVPLQDQEYGGEPGHVEQTRDLVLTPGDSLYLPRGWIHGAIAQDDISIHATVGFHPLRWVDVLEEVADIIAHGRDEIRYSVPVFSDPTDEKDLTKLIAHFQSVTELVREPLIIQEALTRLTRRRRARQTHLQNQLAQIRDVEMVDLQSTLAVRPGLVPCIERSDGGLIFVFSRKNLSLPEFIEPALRFVMEQERFTAADLPPCLDDEGKLVLVRRLIREGYLYRPMESSG